MKAGEDGVCVKYPSSVLATVPSVFSFSCQMYGKSGRAYIYKMCQSLFHAICHLTPCYIRITSFFPPSTPNQLKTKYYITFNRLLPVLGMTFYSNTLL